MNDKGVVEKYDRALREYANEVLPGFWNELKNQRRPFQPFLDKLFGFYLYCLYLTDSNLFHNDEKYPSLNIRYVKACLALFGIHNCLQYGLVTESAVLLRSLFESYLFESYLNVKLILQKDTEERIGLFHDFRYVERWNSLQANKNLLEEGKISKEIFDRTFTSDLIKKIEDNYLSVKSNYHPKHPYHWAWKIFRNETKNQRNPSIHFIADKLGLSADCIKVYGPLSVSVHNSPSLLNLVLTGNAITLAPNFSRSIYNIGCLSLGYLSDLIEDLVNYLEFGEPGEISTYLSIFWIRTCNEDQGAG
ncbi:MAG: hypothetical protein HYW01_05595 [Deltaproteobacteria bacterium]|nr:hypothetical protein [Deltaproteobacteria bacterium]